MDDHRNDLVAKAKEMFEILMAQHFEEKDQPAPLIAMMEIIGQRMGRRIKNGGGTTDDIIEGIMKITNLITISATEEFLP